MDYEKKYKEALERFKTFREKYCTYGELHFGDVIFDKTGEAQKDLDAIFPELRESEDERISKEIIKFLRSPFVTENITDEKIDPWIAYLEKQKEATPCSVDEFTLTLRNCLSTDSELTKEQADIFATVYGKELLNVAIGKVKSGLTKEDIDDFKTEKQKEQKPILEVFGFKVGDAVRLKDGDGRKHIIKSFEEVEGLHGPNFYHVEFEDNSARTGIYPGEEYPNGYYTQMEKFKEGQKPEEKPINWTELTWEDINELEEIINKVHYEFRNGIGQESFGEEVLEQFREYKGDEYLDEIEQKPAEWSEEDENMRNNTILSLQSLIDEGINDEFIKGVKDEIAWLKSLRPSWKPSEEQMNFLLAVINDPNNAGAESCYLILESLYNDLKKLI